MLAYIIGNLTHISTSSISIETNGVGFEINTYEYVIRRLPSLSSEVKIVTYMDVKKWINGVKGCMS